MCDYMKSPEQYKTETKESIPLSVFDESGCSEIGFTMISAQNSLDSSARQIRVDSNLDAFLVSTQSIFRVSPVKMKDIIEFFYN
mmetsp:Transcript_42703/g.65552  ORF Transcript_42703/g.65552 Transcript_42703/m.65552 type:complete len:84 (+) Transcript_42703:1019-1270(+)